MIACTNVRLILDEQPSYFNLTVFRRVVKGGLQPLVPRINQCAFVD